MEIGSGKAVASAYISSFKDVQEVTALDYSYTSLADLLPISYYQFKGSNPWLCSFIFLYAKSKVFSSIFLNKSFHK